MLIIGGSGGIGGAIALEAAKAGWRLELVARDSARLEARAMLCKESSPEEEMPDILAEDLARRELSSALMEKVHNCDALVLAYGPFVMKSLEDTADKDWEAMSWANFGLPGMLASNAAREMAGRGFGRLLFFGGTRTDAIRSYRKNAAYAAAKTALAVVCKSLAGEYSTRGVSTALICPGLVETEYQSEAFKAKMAALAPKGRQTKPETLAELALWLLSGGMDLCNGAIINADEGLPAL